VGGKWKLKGERSKGKARELKAIREESSKEKRW